jgi:hypothetical protein
VSRYTDTPVGAAFTSIAATLQGLQAITGTTAMMASAVSTLQDADLSIVSQMASDGVNLLNGDLETLVALTTAYINDLQLSAPYHAIDILFSLANDYASDGTPYQALLNVVIINALAAAIVGYSPSTNTEAQNLLTQFIGLFDDTLPLTSDLGWAATTQSINTVRMQVCSYLQSMIAQRPSVLTQAFADSLPDVVVAYMLYQDATRAEELTQMNNPDSPMFLPNIILYKSS